MQQESIDGVYRPEVFWMFCSHSNSSAARRGMWSVCCELRRIAICYVPPSDDRTLDYLELQINRFQSIPIEALTVIRGKREILGACRLGEYERIETFPFNDHHDYLNTRIMRAFIDLPEPFPVSQVPHTLPRTNFARMSNEAHSLENLVAIFGSINPLE